MKTNEEQRRLAALLAVTCFILSSRQKSKSKKPPQSAPRLWGLVAKLEACADFESAYI